MNRRPSIRVLLLAALLLAATVTAHAQQATFPPRPKQHWYVDEAGLISKADAEAIDAIAGTLWRQQQIPIIAVTVPSLASHNAAGYTIERYAFELFNHWGIGSQRRNYGMLLLVARDDRRARIELGDAWGYKYNAEARQVMDTLIIPRFKQGRFSEGILEGMRGMDAMSRGLRLPAPVTPWWVYAVGLGLLGFVITLVVSLFRNGRKGWGWAVIVFLGAVLFFLMRAAVANATVGGGFGGGSSGGGGASGSW